MDEGGRLITLPSSGLELAKGLRLCISRAFQNYFQYVHLHVTYMIDVSISHKTEQYFAFVRPVVEIGYDFPVMINPLTASYLQENYSSVDFLFHLTYLGIIFLSLLTPFSNRPSLPLLLHIHLQLLGKAFSGKSGGFT